MAKTKVSEWDANPNNNTDIDSINIDEGCAPSGINNAIREVMAQVKDFQQGTNGDSFNGPVNGTIGATTPASGAFTTLTTSGNTTLGNDAGDVITINGASTFNASVNIASGTISGAFNGTVGATTPSTGAFTTLSASGNVTLSGGTANGVAYLNGSKVVTTGSALTFDGTNLGIGTSSPNQKLELSITSGTYQMRLGAGTTSASYTYDIGRSTVDGYLRFYGNQAAAQGYIFGGANGEYARLDYSGNLLVGATTTSGITNGASDNAHAFISFEGNVNAQRNNGACVYLSKASGYTSSALISFYVTGTERGSITTSGTAVAYNTSSDYRLKENIQPMTGALAKVAALKPVIYKWKADGSDGEGFIAHELAEVVPQCVTGEKDAVDAEGNPKYQGIDTSFLAGLYAAALQELMAEVNSLKAEIQTLKGN